MNQASEPEIKEQDPPSESAAPVTDSADQQAISHSFILAAAETLGLGGGRRSESPRAAPGVSGPAPVPSEADRNDEGVRPVAKNPSPAEIKKFLWMNSGKTAIPAPPFPEGTKTLRLKPWPGPTTSPPAVAPAPPAVPVPAAVIPRSSVPAPAVESARKTVARGQEDLPHRLERMNQELRTAVARLSQAKTEAAASVAPEKVEPAVPPPPPFHEPVPVQKKADPVPVPGAEGAAGTKAGSDEAPKVPGAGESPRRPGSLCPYTDYWKLKCLPFENSADSKFFYESSGHREGITRFIFSIETRKALAVFTGDYGSGKSVLCQTVVARLAPAQFKIALVSNPRLEAQDLIREIASKFGEDITSTSKYDILHAFNGILDRSYTAGRHCVAIIDEAQIIAISSILEDLRLLLNHQRDGKFLLTLVLVGQTELINMLRLIPQMYQRVSLKYHIPYLAGDEVRGYVRHRLAVAGGSIDILEEAAVVELEKLSKGNPREINALCDMALLTAAMSGRSRVSAEDILEAGKERA